MDRASNALVVKSVALEGPQEFRRQGGGVEVVRDHELTFERKASAPTLSHDAASCAAPGRAQVPPSAGAPHITPTTRTALALKDVSTGSTHRSNARPVNGQLRRYCAR